MNKRYWLTRIIKDPRELGGRRVNGVEISVSYIADGIQIIEDEAKALGLPYTYDVVSGFSQFGTDENLNKPVILMTVVGAEIEEKILSHGLTPISRNINGVKARKNQLPVEARSLVDNIEQTKHIPEGED